VTHTDSATSGVGVLFAGCGLPPSVQILNKGDVMADNFYRPRLSIEIGEDLQKRLQDLVPWGLRSQLMTVLLEDVLDMIEKEGDIVTALIIKRKLHAKDITKGGKDG
jgi:hypothetical protein